MTFAADYPGAIPVPARNYGYVVGGKHLINNPKAWALHTPEEPADNVPSTPYYFAGTDRDASTTYFVSYLGLVFQCVPESEGAYANAVEGKPYPAWADSTVNLNLQTLSIEIEGYAATIHQTMPRGSPQWRALVNLMAHRCKARNIPPGRTFGHYQVSVNRSDPGQLNIPLLVADVIAEMKGGEEDMPKLIHTLDTNRIYVVGEGGKRIASDVDKRLFGSALDVYQVEADLIPTVPAGSGSVDTAAFALAVRAILKSDPLK